MRVDSIDAGQLNGFALDSSTNQDRCSHRGRGILRSRCFAELSLLPSPQPLARAAPPTVLAEGGAFQTRCSHCSCSVGCGSHLPLDSATTTGAADPAKDLQHNAIEALSTMLKTGWRRCSPPCADPQDGDVIDPEVTAGPLDLMNPGSISRHQGLRRPQRDRHRRDRLACPPGTTHQVLTVKGRQLSATVQPSRFCAGSYRYDP